mmetsp:Transcript_21867/g.76747  ORF Transcript_21867/g.76747 Transcript_21867/m.76747 type:complete len:266 (+) Transcript_21867:614-1411(+)
MAVGYAPLVQHSLNSPKQRGTRQNCLRIRRVGARVAVRARRGQFTALRHPVGTSHSRRHGRHTSGGRRGRAGAAARALRDGGGRHRRHTSLPPASTIATTLHARNEVLDRERCFRVAHMAPVGRNTAAASRPRLEPSALCAPHRESPWLLTALPRGAALRRHTHAPNDGHDTRCHDARTCATGRCPGPRHDGPRIRDGPEDASGRAGAARAGSAQGSGDQARVDCRRHRDGGADHRWGARHQGYGMGDISVGCAGGHPLPWPLHP